MMECLCDENRKVSSSRIILLVITFLFAVLVLVDVFTIVEVHSQIYNIIMAVYGFGLGGNAASRTVSNLRGKSE